LPAVEPQQLQPIPASVPADVMILLQKYPAILKTGDVRPTPTHGVEYHIHTGSHPPVFANPTRLDPEKLESAKAEFKGWNPLALFLVQNHHGPLLCTWCPKKMDHGGLVAITAVLT
jgi:hypothetical protein